MNHEESWNEHHCRGPLGVFRIIAMAIGGLLVAVLLGFLFGYFVMLLWNWLMPSLFGLKTVTYWQGFGLVVLAKILFGGHGAHGWHGRAYDHHNKMFRKRFGDNWAPKGDCRNWKYYEEYWNTEGKAAYEAYIDRIKSEGK